MKLDRLIEMQAKIGKRGRKLVDYDGARHAVESLQTKTGKKDEIKIAKSREQMEESRRLYEVLNKELHDELPALYDSRIPFLISTLQTLFASETTFHTENSKIYGQFSELIDALALEAQRGAYHSGLNSRRLLSTPDNLKGSNYDSEYPPPNSIRPNGDMGRHSGQCERLVPNIPADDYAIIMLP